MEHPELLAAVRQHIVTAKARSFQPFNTALLEMYWQIGKLIAERDEYTLLAKQLTAEFGKGFDEQRLRKMKALYKAFPVWHAVRKELGWTHYKVLS